MQYPDIVQYSKKIVHLKMIFVIIWMAFSYKRYVSYIFVVNHVMFIIRI